MNWFQNKRDKQTLRHDKTDPRTNKKAANQSTQKAETKLSFRLEIGGASPISPKVTILFRDM